MIAPVVRLNKAQVVANLPTYTQLFPAIKEVMKEFSAREVDQPLRTRLGLPEYGAFLTMPAYIPSRDVLGVKNVASIPANKGRELPTHISTIQLYNTYGQLLCDLDGDVITGVRTGAASAIATQFLANSNSSILAIVGAGVQAETHIDAMLSLPLPLSRVNVWNRTEERATKLVECMQRKYPKCEFQVYQDIKEAVQNADIICTATSSRDPVISLADVKPGVHINVVGACSSAEREIADNLMKSDLLTIVCDSEVGAYKESGDICQTGVKVHCELGDLVCGDKKVVWDADTITLFKNNGLACQDVVTADIVYRNYLKKSNL